MGLARPTGDELARAIAERTGHAFADLRLLETALTHSSAVRAVANNERLEFLGDRVLGLVVADMLFKQFPDAPEGEIAPRFNALVDARTCSQVGVDLELDLFVRADAALKARTRGAGGNYLADAVEALIAAIYLDGGLEAARGFILRLWQPRVHTVVAKPPNPKSELQEWAAKIGDARPEYVIDRREGPDHEPVFTVSVRIDGFEPASGTGGSRRSAEEAAATALLRREGVWGHPGERGMTAADDAADAAKPETRSGFVALIGATNAGKSTLVNQLVGSKVSIVTHKVQTTRALVRGIVTHGAAQIVFVDTPGIFRPRRKLDSAMVTTAWGGAKDADVLALLIDAERGIRGDADAILDRLADVRQPKLLLLNKVDRVKPETLLALAQAANEKVPFERTFMVSALTGSGCKDFLDYLAGSLPAGPWYYPEDQISDLPMRQLSAEVTREKLYLRLHQELPYASHVETEKWEEKADGSVRIEQVIYVERDSQKKIVLGEKGRTIRAIGESARKEIADILEQKVHLFLFVKVRENWGNDPERYREMGLEFPGSS